MDRYRPPDWRWRRVTRILGNGGSLSRFKDDVHVQRGVKMLQAVRDGSGSEEDIRGRFLAEYEAHLIHTRREERGVRWMLEAGILARQTPETLGEYLGIPASTAEAYEKLFFDVRDKLDRSGYIATHVFEFFEHGCRIEKAISRWLGRVAYHAGWDAVRHIWEANKPTLEASQFLREALVDSIFTNAINELNGALAERCRHPEAVEAAIGVLRKEIETGGPSQRTGVEKALMGLLGSAQIRVLDPREKLPAEEPRCQPVDLSGARTGDGGAECSGDEESAGT